MSDIVERLRGQCNCNIDTSPCGAEEECRAAFEAADEIERLRGACKELAESIDRIVATAADAVSRASNAEHELRLVRELAAKAEKAKEK